MYPKIIKRGANVVALTLTASVFPHAVPRPAEIEAQGGKTGEQRGFGGAVHHFVVHGAAKHRVWMANQRHLAGSNLRIPFHQRFQRSIRPGDKCAIDFRKSPRELSAISVQHSATGCEHSALNRGLS
jgi:hypothetical protein